MIHEIDYLFILFIMAETQSNKGVLAAVKVSAMIIMFLVILIFGSIPLRAKAYKTNEVYI